MVKFVGLICLDWSILTFLRPIIEDLNCYGEIVTLIDPNADVIQDPAVQKILKSLDGERTVVSLLEWSRCFNGGFGGEMDLIFC